jgi:hypothetical protein
MVATRAAHAETIDEVAAKVVKIFERIGEDADANKPDCEKMGTALSKHLAEDAAIMKQIKEDDAKKSTKQKAEDKEAVKAKYGERMKAAMAKAAPLKACKTNAKVKAYAEQVMR